MEIITYDVSKGGTLLLGHQLDHKAVHIDFEGFEQENELNVVYFKLDGVGLYPLFEMGMDVLQTFTLERGFKTGQLVEIAPGNELVKNSASFMVSVLPSVEEDNEIVTDDPDIDLWFGKMSALYAQVVSLLDSGELASKTDYDEIKELLRQVRDAIAAGDGERAISLLDSFILGEGRLGGSK